MSNKHSFVSTRNHIAPPAKPVFPNNIVSHHDGDLLCVVMVSTLVIALLCTASYMIYTPPVPLAKSHDTVSAIINRPYIAYDRISFVDQDGSTNVVVHINDGRVEHKLGSLAEAGEHAAVAFAGAFAGAVAMASPDSPYNVASKIVFADNDGRTMVMIYPDGGVVHSYITTDADTFWSAFAARLKKIRQ